MIRRRQQCGFSTLELVVIFTIAVILASFIVSKYSVVTKSHRDETRKNDMSALQLGIQSYWAQTGNFPSLAQMNNVTFRNDSLNKLDPAVAQDPSWHPSNKYCASRGKLTFEASVAPHSGCYGYMASPTGCDNKAVACSGYNLNARLENGTFYSKSSS
jgi:Tfp pilus assembly protein PilE